MTKILVVRFGVLSSERKREDGKKLEVDKPSTQMTGQPMSVTGTTDPGRKVTVKGHWPEEEDKHHLATAGPDGRYGATLISPNKPGVNTVSVSSTDATTTTTFPVRDPQKKKP